MCVFFRANMTINELPPNSRLQQNIFKHEASKLKCFISDCMQRYVFECFFFLIHETNARKIFVIYFFSFFLHNSLVDTMQ